MRENSLETLRPRRQIWIPKAICIMSTVPYYDFFQCVLLDLYYTMTNDFAEMAVDSWTMTMTDLRLHAEQGADRKQQDCSKRELRSFKQFFSIEQYVKQLVYGLPPHKEGLQIKYQINSEFLNLRFGSYFVLDIPADNQLPYVNTRFFDRFFRIMRVDEIVALYTALLSEDKSILMVCEDKFDIIPFITTLLDLMHPFQWCLSKIPFLVMEDPNDTSNPLLGVINGIQNIIIGIHESSYRTMRLILEEENEPERLENMIIIELTGLYQSDDINGDDTLPLPPANLSTTRDSAVLAGESSMRGSAVPGMGASNNHKSEGKKPRISKSMLGAPNISYPDEKSKPKRLFQFAFPAEPPRAEDYLEKIEYDFKNKHNNEHKNLELPYKLEKELIAEINTQLAKVREAEKERLKKNKDNKNEFKQDHQANYGNLLQKEHIKAIREKFYDTTSKLFYNWYKYMFKENYSVGFKIAEFMAQENCFFNDNGWFYHNMFYNDLYEEPENKKEPEQPNNQKYKIKQQYFNFFIENSFELLNQDSSRQDVRINHFYHKMLDLELQNYRNTGVDDKIKQKLINAQQWLKHERGIMGPLYIKFDNIKSAHVPLFQVLKSIDHNITNFYKDNLKKIQENPCFGDEIDGLFCFKKFIEGGYYFYFLFPQLDLNLIENQDLMHTFDRSEHIHKALQAWEE